MPRPTMHPVESSNVASIGHDGTDMHVAYKSMPGGVYVYKGVPVSTFQEARAAKSVGGYIAAHVKGKYAVEVGRSASAPADDLEQLIGKLQTPVERGRKGFEHIMASGTDAQRGAVLVMIEAIQGTIR